MRWTSLLTLLIVPVWLRAATLDIYYVDTEGGQATLFVAPSGQTVLVDTGNEGTRDPTRIMQVINAAGVSQIDYLLITHYHGDHIGGFLELSKLVPIRHYVDHGPTVQPEQNSASKRAYDATVATAPHLIVRPGERLPVDGLEWTIVSAAGATLTKDMSKAPGAGIATPACAQFEPKDISNDLENAQSVGSVIRYGDFRSVDLGDLLWNWEERLVCPVNHIGTVDVLLTTHHGLALSNPPALVYGLAPRVVIMNNGLRKGGAVETFQTVESSPGLEDLWQLHWSANALLEYNMPGQFIANIEPTETVVELMLHPPHGTQSIGNPEHSPAYWLKVSASSDGSFTVSNSRNGFSKTYRARPARGNP